ncbi:MAG TPA: peptide ABC transporter permease [Firmicutes bacterium]|nr:peptide ABC transporter permease [Bacillota bacterium]HBL51170.1 peptide ABC transporter permease [Bacillota bacterium]HBL69300.1 peptide ABC transporter permease [Bacillota bacterium]HCF93411.1 peptide ABC transporter permease [Bacillota bacterium]HCT37281.1 peptide ABC transporter permease [Bacillota bacterium]
MAWRKFRRHKLAIVGAIMTIILLILAIFAPLITPYSFEELDLGNMFAPPSWDHIFGTDELGQDVFTRILYGGRISLLVGFASAFTAVVFGILIGSLAGFYGGWLDNLLMRFTDMMMTIPTLPLLIVLSSLLGGSVANIILLMIIFSWMTTARLVRGAVLTFKQQEFIEAARALGVSSGRIIFRHLLPNAMAPAVVSATLMVGGNIIWESSLSFLGLGIQPPTPSWGNMLSRAQEYIWTAPWLAVWPGLFILFTVLGFNFLGDGLRDALDPRSKLG